MQQKEIISKEQLITDNLNYLPINYRFIERVESSSDYIENLVENTYYQCQYLVLSPFYKSVSGL